MEKLCIHLFAGIYFILSSYKRIKYDRHFHSLIRFILSLKFHKYHIIYDRETITRTDPYITYLPYILELVISNTLFGLFAASKNYVNNQVIIVLLPLVLPLRFVCSSNNLY